jgi:hypothetical protein
MADFASPPRVFGNRGQLAPQGGSAPQPVSVSQQQRVSTPGGEPHPMSPRGGGGEGMGSFGATRQRDEEADEVGLGYEYILNKQIISTEVPFPSNLGYFWIWAIFAFWRKNRLQRLESEYCQRVVSYTRSAR